MLVHPFEYRLTPIPGTRLLEETFDVVGETVEWPPGRRWNVLGLYAPKGGRYVLAGVRARVKDQKGVYSFINQRDLEILLDPRLVGTWCKWMGEEYPEPGQRLWYGPCTDVIDLQDDLHAIEMELRADMDCFDVPLPPLSVERTTHDNGSDWHRVELLLQDQNKYTGASPDLDVKTISDRWVTSERSAVSWRRM